MPNAALRPCAQPGCPTLVRAGYCDQHRPRARDMRQSASRRGYGRAWEDFRRRFDTMLQAAGLASICGAALPGGPTMAASQCRAAGLVNGWDLHLDHDPPLADYERQSVKAVCDPRRVGWLCRRCHAAKTASERARAAAG